MQYAPWQRPPVARVACAPRRRTAARRASRTPRRSRRPSPARRRRSPGRSARRERSAPPAAGDRAGAGRARARGRRRGVVSTGAPASASSSRTSSATAGDDDTPVERIAAACTRFVTCSSRSTPIHRIAGRTVGREHLDRAVGRDRRHEPPAALHDPVERLGIGAAVFPVLVVDRGRADQHRPVGGRRDVDAAGHLVGDAADDLRELPPELAVEQPGLAEPRPAGEVARRRPAPRRGRPRRPPR